MPEFLVWKLIAVVAVCFAAGVWRGVTGRTGQEQRGKEQPPRRDD